MAGYVRTCILKLCVLTNILVLITAQTDHMTNIAVNKSCNMSSRYVGGIVSGDCSAAINGNINTTLVTDRKPQNCIHTNESDIHPFWSVDLGQSISVHTITIYGRDQYEARMTCVEVSLDGRELYMFPCPGKPSAITDITLHPPQRGRVVNITRNQPSGGDPVPFLNICEIQIWVCSSGYWGDNCTVCSAGCNNTCDAKDGACRCTNGWTGAQCTDCSDGYYNVSNDCQNTCGKGCNNTCSRTDGTCQCRPEWQPPLCQSCAGGYWGDTCTHLCGPGCEDGVCDAVQGTCECEKGWDIPTCQDCADGHYNVSNECRNTCGRGCNNTCNKTDGTCQCRLGWQPPLCQWCADGWFGSECRDCGHCANNSVCDKKTGVCPFCNEDFVAPLCLDAVPQHNDVKDSCSMAGPVAGAAVGCSLVFFIVGAIFGWWMTRSRSNQPPKADYSHEGFSTKSNLGTSALSLRHLAERPEPSKDRSEDTPDYENIGLDSNIYEESVIRDNKKTTYTPLNLPANSENTDMNSDYINASVRAETAGRGKPKKF